MALQKTKVDKERILWRMTNWKTRLSKLYEKIENWANELGEIEIKKKIFLKPEKRL